MCGWANLRSYLTIPFNQNQYLMCSWANLRSYPAILFNQNQNMYYYQLNDSFFFFFILLDFFEDFPVTNEKYVCNALRLDDMHASLPDLKYRSPLFDVPSS